MKIFGSPKNWSCWRPFSREERRRSLRLFSSAYLFVPLPKPIFSLKYWSSFKYNATPPPQPSSCEKPSKYAHDKDLSMTYVFMFWFHWLCSSSGIKLYAATGWEQVIIQLFSLSQFFLLLLPNQIPSILEGVDSWALQDEPYSTIIPKLFELSLPAT